MVLARRSRVLLRWNWDSLSSGSTLWFFYAVYDFIGEPEFSHDFENIQFDATEFDARLGAPGLHDVGKSVRPTERRTILPPDLFRRVERDSFWQDPEQNPYGVRIV